MLVKYGAEINMFDPMLACSPVFCAFQQKNHPIVLYLVEQEKFKVQ